MIIATGPPSVKEKCVDGKAFCHIQGNQGNLRIFDD